MADYFINVIVRLMSAGVANDDLLRHLYQPGMKCSDLKKALADCESKWAREIDSIICRMSSSFDTHLYGFPLQALDLVAFRIGAASVLLSSLRTGIHSPFGAPSWGAGECVYWILNDWWEEHGRNLSVEIYLSGVI